MKSNVHDLEMCLHHETEPDMEDEGAILVSLCGTREKAIWLPKSQAQYERKAGTTVTVTAPEWLLMKKGLI